MLLDDDSPYMNALRSLVFLIVMIVMTELIYRHWETPFRNWGKRIARRIEEKPDAFPPAPIPS